MMPREVAQSSDVCREPRYAPILVPEIVRQAER
jgi:hypothetical protein